MDNAPASTVPSTAPVPKGTGAPVSDDDIEKWMQENLSPETLLPPTPLDPSGKPIHKYEADVMLVALRDPEWFVANVLNRFGKKFHQLFRNNTAATVAKKIAEYYDEFGGIPAVDDLERRLGVEEVDDWSIWDAIAKGQLAQHQIEAMKKDITERWLRASLYHYLITSEIVQAIANKEYTLVRGVMEEILALDDQLASGGKRKQKFAPVPLAEFIANAQPIRFMVEGVLSINSTALLAGLMKGGKSMFAQHLALHLAWGKSLGAMKINAPYGVLYLSAEDDASVFRYRLGTETHPPNFFVQYGKPIDLFTGEGVSELIAFMKKHSLRFLVIDSLNRFHSAESENDAPQMTTVIGHCDEIANRIDGTVLVVHHFAKNKDLDGVMRARGSSVITSMPRTILNWRNVDPSTSAVSINGNSTTVSDLTVRYVGGKVMVEDGAPMREETLAEREKLVDSVNKLGLIKPEGSTADEIRQDSGSQKSEHSVRNMLEDLASDVHKRITMVVNGRKKVFQPRCGE